MTETRTLNKQTIVQTENKTEQAKRILFDPIKLETANVAENDLQKFSTDYETEKLNKIYDAHDLMTVGLNSSNANEQVLANNLSKSFQDVIASQNIQSASTEQKVLSQPKFKAKEQVKASLNFRGKLVITVAVSIFALLGFLGIYNAVSIQNINTEIQTMTTEVSQSESNLSQLWQEYSTLKNEKNIKNVVEEQGMSLLPAESQIQTQLNLTKSTPITASSNWFDAICNFLAGLFH